LRGWTDSSIRVFRRQFASVARSRQSSTDRSQLHTHTHTHTSLSSSSSSPGLVSAESTAILADSADKQQTRSQDLEVGAQEVWGVEVPQRVPGTEPLVGVRGEAPLPKAHSILRILGCQTMHNFVCLAKVHEPPTELSSKLK